MSWPPRELPGLVGASDVGESGGPLTELRRRFPCSLAVCDGERDSIDVTGDVDGAAEDDSGSFAWLLLRDEALAFRLLPGRLLEEAVS